MKTHYTEKYLLDPTHPVTVALIGCGGTGSMVLTCLARVDSALKALGHPGFQVIAFDSKKITRANLARQLFSAADVGAYKTTVLITRINRFFGLDWQAHPTDYKPALKKQECTAVRSNILISCTDTVASRKTIAKMWMRSTNAGVSDYSKLYYWLDFGNSQKTGQVVLGSFGNIAQPSKDGVAKLLTVVEKFDLSKVDEDAQGPSCSLIESLHNQDLFVNSTLAQLGMDLLWKLFRELKITYHGCYMNLETMKVNPIMIQ